MRGDGERKGGMSYDCYSFADTFDYFPIIIT